MKTTHLKKQSEILLFVTNTKISQKLNPVKLHTTTINLRDLLMFKMTKIVKLP